MTKRFLSLALFSLLLSMSAQVSFAQVSGIKPDLVMYRYNSSSTGSPTPVVTGNTIGTIKWNGLTAIGNIQTGASIRSTVRNSATGVLAGDITFATNNGTSLNDRMIIRETGLVGIGIMDPQYHLHVIGNTHTSGRFYGRIHFDNNSAADDAPNTYFDEAYFERKLRSTLNVPAVATANNFGGILSLAPGGGAHDHQLFFGQDGIWNRRETSNGAAWTAAWEKLLSSADIKGTPNRIARFLPPDNPSSKLGDSQLFDDGTDVGIGTVTPDAAYLLTVAGDTRIIGSERIDNNLAVDGTSTLTGNVNMAANATVTGNTSSGSLTVTNNASAGSLTVTNNASAGSLTVTNNASAGSLTVTNNASAGSLNVNSDALVGNNCRVNGRVIIGNPATAPETHELYVNGSAIAEEVVVKLQVNWPDYVFEQNYELQPLAEVEQFIKENKHLPGIASAQEVAADGLELGKTQRAQMEKIEELYLHMIAMEKRMNALEIENTQLKSALSAKK